MLLQSLTVLPSHCHCGSTFLRVTWRVDLTGDLAELEDLTKSGVKSGTFTGRCLGRGFFMV